MSVKPISAGFSGALKGAVIGALALALVPQLGGFKILLETAKHSSGNIADSHNKPSKSIPTTSDNFTNLGIA